MTTPSMTTPTPTPKLSGLHHVSLPVADLDAAAKWFEDVFGAEYLPELDHADGDGSRFAVVVRVPGVPAMVLLRVGDEIPEVAPLALGVPDRAELDRWAAHFAARDIEHSDVRAGRAGHVLTCTMPGGPALVLYAG